MGMALLGTGGMSLPSLANANLTEAIPREGCGGGTKLKLLSLIQVYQRSRFFLPKRAHLTFFPLSLKLILHFSKANFRTSHKIR